LQRFIATYVASVEQLEILCLLNQDPKRSWSVPEVFREIQSSERSVAECLELFRGCGLLARQDGGYRFAPASPALGDTMARLCQAYHERRVSIVEMIYRRPSDTLQDFIDAFKLRKDP
jgi:DNA-binding IclR family transcriptional regulator